MIWPVGDSGASVTRWRCWIPKGLPEFLNVVELEVHHHIQSSLQESSEGGRGDWMRGREEWRENRGRKGGQNIQSWTMATRHTTKFLQAGRQAASRSVRALLVRQWASLNTAPCTLIIRRTLKAKFMLLQTFFLMTWLFSPLFLNLDCLSIANNLIDLCIHFSGGLLTWTNSCDFLFPVPMYQRLLESRDEWTQQESKRKQWQPGDSKW